MSRKQEIYQQILLHCLPGSRNALSGCVFVPWWRWFSPRWKQYIWNSYARAEFVHNLPVSILEPEFTEHDLWFLNVQARSFFEDPKVEANSLLAELVKELIEIMPTEMKNSLEWQGPGKSL